MIENLLYSRQLAFNYGNTSISGSRDAQEFLKEEVSEAE
jgi:hypothetical protein